MVMRLVERLENAAYAMDDALNGGRHAFAVIGLPVLSYALQIVDVAKRNKAAVRCNGEYKIAKDVFDGFLLGRFSEDQGREEVYSPRFESKELSSVKVVLEEALRLYQDGVINLPRTTVF